MLALNDKSTYPIDEKQVTTWEELYPSVDVRQELGVQVALHCGESSVLDSDQLAWALAIVISQPKDYQSNLAEQDFIRQAFKCLFDTQETVGTWRHYAPLFHYPRVGNAYCYVFETFTTLLTLVLKPEADFLQGVLKNYSPELIRLWEYAKSTQSEIWTSSGKKGYAWSSGHRIQPKLESWATASVFSYAQALRKLLGIWTREEALKSLNLKPGFTTTEEAIAKLARLANTWTHSDLGDLLASMFVNPLLTANRREDCDPDEPLIEKDAVSFRDPFWTAWNRQNLVSERYCWSNRLEIYRTSSQSFRVRGTS